MEKDRLTGPIHRLGDWIIDRFVHMPRAAKTPLWRYWHAMMIKWDANYDALSFMNYGYAPIDEPELDLLPEDRAERFGAYLYDVAVSHVSVKDTELLEVSSGRGGGASYITRYLKPARYVGLDLSRKNVQACSRVYGKIPGVSFVQGDALELPFPDNSYDRVVNVEASRAYGNLEKFFSEVRRVLRPGGCFLLTDMRLQEDIDPLRHTLTEAGFTIDTARDITPNVVRALDVDSDRKIELMKRKVPRMFLSAFSEFAGIRGSERYRAFAEGRM